MDLTGRPGNVFGETGMGCGFLRKRSGVPIEIQRRRPSRTCLDGSMNDTALLRLAGRQHGLVAMRKLARMGYAEYHIRWRIRVGLLFRVYRGVYAVAGAADTFPRGSWPLCWRRETGPSLPTGARPLSSVCDGSAATDRPSPFPAAGRPNWPG